MMFLYVTVTIVNTNSLMFQFKLQDVKTYLILHKTQNVKLSASFPADLVLQAFHIR